MRSLGITPVECRASLRICVLVRTRLGYIEAQSIEYLHVESADIMDSWDWQTPGSWIWRTLLSPHRLTVRSIEQKDYEIGAASFLMGSVTAVVRIVTVVRKVK